jgi:hypothetical protein
MTDSPEPLAITADDEQSLNAPTPRPSFGALLMEAGLVTREQLYQALAEGTRTGERLGEVLIRHGLTSEHDVARMLSEQFQLPLLEAHAVAADPAGWNILPPSEARRLEACVVSFEGEAPVAAVADPNDARFNSLRESLGEETRFAIVTGTTLNQLLDGAPTEDLAQELSAAAAAADAVETAASETAEFALVVADAPFEDDEGETAPDGDDHDGHPDGPSSEPAASEEAEVELAVADAPVDDEASETAPDGDDHDGHPHVALAEEAEAVADAEEAGVDPAPLPPPAAGDDSEADERHVDPDTILADFDGVTAKLQDSVETLKSLRVRLAHVVETSVGSFRELDACHKELDAERAAREQDQEKMRQLEEQLTDRTQLLAEMKAKLGDFMSGLEPRL